MATNSTIDKILSRPLQPGTWKFFHPNAKTSVDCLYGTISCVGSHVTAINHLVHQLINGSDIGLLSDEAYCSEHFSGALCSQSSSGYYIDWASHQSLACQDGASSSLFRSFMLCIPLALLLPIIICFTVGRTYKKRTKKSNDIPPSRLPSVVRWLLSYEAESDLSNTSQILDNNGIFGRVISSRLEQSRIPSLQSHHSEINIEDLYNNKDEDSVTSTSNHPSSRVVLRRVDKTSDSNSVSNSTCGSINSMQSNNHVIISKKNRSVYEATLLKLQSELIANELTFNDMEISLPSDVLPAKEGTVAFPPESSQWREIHFQQARRSYRAMGYLFKVKIFIASLQLTASLPSSTGMSYLPPMTASLLRIYSNISLVSVQAIPTDCIGSWLGYHRADTVLLMQMASCAPLLVLATLLAGYLLQTEMAHLNGIVGRYYRDNLHRLSLRYSTVAWMMVIILVAGVGQLALKCFTCVDIDPDRIFSSGTQVLWNDPSVLCSDSNYNIGVVWATAASFTYILGVPLVMWVALRYTGYDRFHNTISGSTETVVDTGSSIHDRYVDNIWKLDFSPSAYLNDTYALLHLSYKRSCKYWELLETVYRILIIAVLPYFTQQSGPAAHLFVIGITALVYALALWWFAPYNNEVNQILAVMSSCQVLCFFIILLAIVVVGESEGNGVDGEVVLDLFMCVVALVTPSLVLYQLLRSAYMSYHGKTDPKYNTTIDLQFVPRDSDPRVTVTQSVKSDIESANGAPTVKEKDFEEKIIDKEDNGVYSFSDNSDDDDNDTAAVSERHSGGKGRRGEPRSFKRKDRGENDINFDSERNSVDGMREPTVVEHGSGKRTAMEKSSATRVSLTVSGSSNYHNINIPEVRFVSGRQSLERAVSDRVLSKRCSGIDCDGTCSGSGVLLLSDRGDVKYGTTFSVKRSAIEDDVNLIPVEGDILCTSENSSNHIRNRRRVDEKDHERGHVQRVVNGGAEADSPWFSLKKTTRDSTACNDDGGDGGEANYPSGQLVVESEERSKKKPIAAYFNLFGTWSEKGMKSPTPVSTSPTASSRKKDQASTPTSIPIQSPSGVRSVKHFFSNDRIEHVIEDGATLYAADSGLVGTGEKDTTRTGKKKARLRVDAKGSERGFVQRVINGSDENISPWFSLKKSTRESAPCDDEVDGDNAGYGLEDIYPSRKIVSDVDGHSKKKPITAYFNPFGAWNEKDTKSSVSPPTNSLVSSAASAAKAQNSAEIVRTAKQLFSRDRGRDRKERNREGDGATGCAAERDLFGSSETDASHIRRTRDRRRVDEKDHERGFVQRIVAGGVEDDSPWFSLKKSTRDTILCENEEDGGEDDGGAVRNPSDQIVIESEERSKKKPITAYFNPFGAWNEKDLKSPTSVSTSPVANSPKKAAKAQTPSPKGRGIEKWASGARTVKQPSSDVLDKCGTVDRDVTAGLGEVGLDDQSEGDSNHIRQKRDFHRVAHKDHERGYVHLVVNGGEEDDNPWFSLKKSPRKMAACDDKEEEDDSDGGEVNILARQKSLSRQVAAESETLIKKKPVTANFNPLGAWNEMDLKPSTPMPKTRTSASPQASSPKKTIAKVQVPTAKAKDTVKWASEVHTAMDPISDDDDDGNELPAFVARNRHRRRCSIPNNFKLLQDTGVDARHIKRNASSSSFIL